MQKVKLKFAHFGAPVKSALDAALLVAKKHPHTRVREQSANKVVLRRAREVDKVISSVIGIPPFIEYEEHWELDLTGDLPRFLVSSEVDIGLYQLKVGTRYQQEAPKASGISAKKKAHVSVVTMIEIRGLERKKALIPLVKTFMKGEFDYLRNMERRILKKMRKKSKLSAAIDEEEEEEEEDDGLTQEQADKEYETRMADMRTQASTITAP